MVAWPRMDIHRGVNKRCICGIPKSFSDRSATTFFTIPIPLSYLHSFCHPRHHYHQHHITSSLQNINAVVVGGFSDLFLVVISVVISRTAGMSINFP